MALISLLLYFIYIVFTYGRSLNRTENTHFEISVDKEPDKVVTVVCHCFKINDDAVLVKWSQSGKQQIEAIIDPANKE